MKKVSLLAALLMAGMLAVTGCNSGEKTTESAETEKPAVETAVEEEKAPAETETKEEAAPAETEAKEETAEEATAEETMAYKDGTYTAEEAEFSEKSGWKTNVTIEVKDGKIVSVDWNGMHKDGGDDKKKVSMDGKYGMVENGGAIAPWHEQAAKVEAYLIETQDPTMIEFKEDNQHTDAIAGATIKVDGFFKLAQEALKDAK